MNGHRLDPGTMRLFSGTSNQPLALEIARDLGMPLETTHIARFSNDNLRIQLGASVRSRTVFIIQSLTPPVSDHLVELMMMLDIARHGSAKEVHALIPYFSYARSDKKDAPRISITARLIADLLETAGATHVMTMVLHSPQVHGFFSVPTDPLSSRPIFKRHFEERDLSCTVVVTPDLGQAKSAVRFARDLGCPVAAGNKERISDTEVRITGIVGGHLHGCKRALVYDDEIATGGSVLELIGLLVRAGIEKLWIACTHGLFVRDSLARIAAIPQVEEIVTTDTVAIPPESRSEKLRILSVAPVFGEAIRRNHTRESIEDLFVFGSKAETTSPQS